MSTASKILHRLLRVGRIATLGEVDEHEPMKLPSTFDRRFITVKGKQVRYVASREDRALTVVLVHGVGLSHRYLMPTAEILADYFKVYAPDLPGFGKSYKPKRVLRLDELADGVSDWLDAMAIPQTAFLGNSVGCQVIISLAVRHPQQVACAVLQGPTVDPEARSFPSQFLRWRRNGRLEAHARDSKQPITSQDYRECGYWRIAKTFYYAIHDNIEEKLPQMQCPTLVIRGARDPIVSQQWAEKVANLIPRGRLAIIPEVAHTLNFVNPNELSDVACPFLAEQGEGGSYLRRRTS